MEEYNELIRKFHEYFTQDANACVSLGIAKHLDDLPDPSIEGIQEAIVAGERLLTELRSFPRGILEFDQMLDLDLAILEVEFSLYSNTYTFNNKTQLQQQPTAGNDISDGIFLIFINDPRPPKERLANITARLEKVPEYLRKLLARLDTPVQRWVDIEVKKVLGLPELFSTIYNWAQEEGYLELERLAVAQQQAEFALGNYINKLKAMPTTTNLFIGSVQASKLITLRGIDQTLEQLHTIAKEFLQDISGEIAELHKRLVAKYQLPVHMTIEELQKFLNNKYQVECTDTGDLEEIIKCYQREREKILNFIERKKLFPIFPEQEMIIMRTPAFMAPSIPAGAMVSPPPFRSGRKTSIVYLTLSTELLDEHTQLSIPSMMIHEGIPGHHLQLATASLHPSIVRRHCNAMEQAEGWTTMLEDYILDMGYMGDLTEEARFSAKRDICRIGARVAIDLYFMTGDKKYLDVGIAIDISSDDPFINAGNLLQKVTGFTKGRVEAELNWYSQEHSYPLCYLTGNKLVWELKADVAKAQQGKLKEIELDREFHKIFLEAGNMPLTFLRRVFEHKKML